MGPHQWRPLEIGEPPCSGPARAARVGKLIPHAKMVELPEEVGPGGDVTDFSVRLGHSRPDFEMLMAQAMPAPPSPEPALHMRTPRSEGSGSELRQRIERIKSDVPIAELVGRYVKLQATGDNLIGLCPFHQDHNPSLAVFPATGTFHCFGCRKRGDVITFVREMEGLRFGQALDRLIETQGLEPNINGNPRYASGETLIPDQRLSLRKVDDS